RRGYPSVFPIRLECRGRFDREAFERAFKLAHERHPFLSARIDRDRKGWPIWVAGDPAPICWTNDSASSNGELAPSTPPARLQAYVGQDADKTVLSFVFHHVAVDGMGAFQFVSDLMVAYAHECSGDAGPPPWRLLNRELLRDRDGHTLLNRRIKLIDLIRAARLSLRLQFRRPAVVSEHDKRPPAGDHAGSALDFLIHTLTEHETAELARVARKLSVRVHDLLIRDYFLMLERWNRGTSESRRPIRICMPANLRRKKDYRMPAANVFSFAFLTRRSGDCEDRARLLESIRGEMAAIKRGKWGLYYEAGLRFFCLWPSLLRWSLNRKWPFATAVFSNLNAGFDHVPLPWRDGRRTAGELVVESGYGAGPIRPETRVAVAIHSYAGRMSISVRCDQHAFGPQQQRAILQAYLDQLKTTTDSES
ncbi:MAG TPA: hypothetical protein VMR25_00270, partial [Planctomycetaceae bacterium]|nr:hypothetical protein [Planctomycetaceae bacterium]